MPASSFATCDACGTFVPDDTRGPVTVGATPVRNVMGLPANLCPACRERWQGATLKDPSPPDVALAWVQAHGRDVDEAPFWRSFDAQGDPVVRGRFIGAYMDRRPTDPLRCPLRAGTMDADCQRATVIAAYLLGEFAAPDLAPIDSPWAWTQIAAWANAHGGEGWDSYRDPLRAPGRYRSRVDAGALRVVCQPDEARDAIVAILRPATVRTIGVSLVTTAGG